MVKQLTKTAVCVLTVAFAVSLVTPASAQLGSAVVEYWSGIGGTGVADLTGNAAYPASPSGFYEITGTLEARNGWGNNYGQRIRGYLHPPQDGVYTFWCVSDDNSQIWVSTDEDPANVVLISETTNWANANDWNDADVTPGTTTLLSANRYYFEVLHKEGSGGDNLSVGWQLPDSTMDRPIDMAYVEGIGIWFVSRDVGTYPGGLGGTADPITLSLEGVGASGDFTCTETLPATLTNIVPGVPTAGSVAVNGQQIVWTITAPLPNSATFSYEVDVPAGLCLDDIAIDGVQDTGDGPKPVGGDPGLLGLNYDLSVPAAEGMADDGLAASSLVAAGANLFNYDVGWDGDPAYPGDSKWYNCLNGFAIYGSGSDIWRNGDHFQFLCFAVEGDFEIAADVDLVQSRDNWTKVGLMARQNLGERAIYFMQRMRGSDGRSDAQWRREENNDSTDPGRPASGNLGTFNVFPTGTRARLHMKREGTSMTLGWADLDSTASAPLGTWIETDFPELPNRVLLGFPLTSHNQSAVAWGTWSNVETTATFSTYAPMIGQPTRSFGTPGYMPGVPVTVSVDVPHVSDGTTITVVENVPDGVIVSNISAGGTQNGNTITWVLGGGFTAPGATVTYDMNVQLPLRPLAFTGGYAEDEMLFHQDTPDSMYYPTGMTTAFQQGVWPDASYSGAADNHIIENTVASNQGAWDHIEEGDWFGTTEGSGLDDHKKILVKFDMSSLPDTTVIDQALLGLYFDAQRRGGITHEPHTLTAFPVLKQWGEGTGNGSDGPAALAGESCWTSPAVGVESWETSGAMGVTDVGPMDGSTFWDAQLNQWVTIDVTASAQSMISTAGAADDQGWKVSQDQLRGVLDATPGNEYVRGAYDAASAQNGNPNIRPILMLFDGTQYKATIGTATRSFSAAEYTWGQPLTVTLTVTNAEALGLDLTITEPLPDGMTAAEISNISGGGAIVGNEIVWTVSPFNADAVVSYDVTVPSTYLEAAGWAYIPLWFGEGSAQDSASLNVPIAASVVGHAGCFTFQEGMLPDTTYSGCQDAQIIVYRPDNNVGGGDRVEEGDWGGGLGDHKKVLIQFDLSGSAINAADIVDAKLLLYAINQRRGGIANEDHVLTPWALLKAWNEGDGPYADGDDARGALADEVTWNNANVGADTGTTVPWEIPGVMGLTDVGTSETSIFWNVSTFPTQALGEWVVFDVTDTVIDMVNTPADNHGWKVSQDKLVGVPDDTPGNEYVAGAYAFVASEAGGGEATLRPVLVIRTTTAVPVDVRRFILW